MDHRTETSFARLARVCVALLATVGACAEVGCGSGTAGGPSGFSALGDAGGAGSGSGSGSSNGSSSGGGSLLNGGGPSGDGGPATGDDGGYAPPATIHAIVRDFRFYDAGDPTTDPDFENPPYNIGPDGGPSPGYQSNWDDRAIVKMQATDGTPAYAGDPTLGTLTTFGNGQAGSAAKEFANWYHDVPGTNIHVDYPLAIVKNPDGSFGYDSQVQGVDYDPVDPTQGKGFFPIDDGTPYATAFGNQGQLHNYSFTVEIRTVFKYKGGEYFNFRGDDDVFVFINGALVINLGGIHSAEPAQVNVDSLGLTPGQTYPLDFFSAERHVTGSNILFQTTLNLQSVVQ
jgi:fibro-slime domain-containing protein